ncbi:NAD-binding protein [Klebsiella variicola subsp. variicola]|nr:NAD-binding protein [Klebsiella variicola subsp. variicola]
MTAIRFSACKHEPRHVIIYGAGVIGCEYASIFRGMEVKVDLINTRDRLLAFLDQGDVRLALLSLLEQRRGHSPQ